jgi:hypothetical protein
MKKSELKQLIKEEIDNIINISQSMPSIQASKKEYDELKQKGKAILSRVMTGPDHFASSQIYKRYPKGQYEIIVKNPYTKDNEVFYTKVNHTPEGAYLEISKLD